MEVKSSKAVTAAEARAILAARKEGGELGYEQSQALENLEVTATADPKKAGGLRNNLAKGKVTGEMAVKLIDVKPENAATVRAILSKDKVELSEEEINDIVKELS
jgi:DNA-directed RNA polymerase subunit F